MLKVIWTGMWYLKYSWINIIICIFILWKKWNRLQNGINVFNVVEPFISLKCKTKPAKPLIFLFHVSAMLQIAWYHHTTTLQFNSESPSWTKKDFQQTNTKQLNSQAMFATSAKLTTHSTALQQNVAYLKTYTVHKTKFFLFFIKMIKEIGMGSKANFGCHHA